MRLIPVLITMLALTSCSLVNQEATTAAVDPSNLPPLSGREQSLIYGADGAMQQQNYAAAERDYLTAIADSKGRVDAHIALANLYEKQHLPQKKKAVLERALTLQPNHPLANYLLGKLHLDANEYGAALAAFERGRVTAPDDIDLTIGAAVTHDMLGEHGAAQSLYAGLLRNNPQTKLTIVRTNLAMSYLLSNSPQQAIDLLKAEVTRTDASPVSRHNLALAYGLLGRHADAKAVLNGDIDEETRLLAVARMKAYHRDRMAAHDTPTLMPAITEVEPAAEAPFAKPVTVIQKTPKQAPAPVVKAKPAAVTPTVVSKPAPVPAPAAAAAPLAPAMPDATDTLEQDPNYIPGLTDEDDALDESTK